MMMRNKHVKSLAAQQPKRSGRRKRKSKKLEKKSKEWKPKQVRIYVKTSQKCDKNGVKDDCIICLRPTKIKNPVGLLQESSDLIEQLETGPSSEVRDRDPTLPSKLLPSLNKIWRFLQKRGHWDGDFNVGCGGDDPTDEFSRLPEMCLVCTRNLDTIHQLIGSLVKEINKLGTFISESNCREDIVNIRNQEESDEEMDEEDGVGMPAHDTNKNGSPVKQEIISSDDNDDDNDEPTFKKSFFLAVPQKATHNSNVECQYEVPTTRSRSSLGNGDSSYSRNNYTDDRLKVKNHEATLCGIDDVGMDSDDDGEEDSDYVKLEITSSSEDNDDEPYDHTLQTHNKKRNGHKLFKCDLCGVNLPVADMHEHVRSHVGDEYVMKCPNPDPEKCSKWYCTIKGLWRHLCKCRLCKDVVPRYKERLMNLRSVCEICGFKGNSALLRYHLLRNHEENGSSGKISCPIDGCSQRFNLRQSVLLHIGQHVSEIGIRNANADFATKKVQNCNTCQLNIPLCDMETHLKNTHFNKEIIRCTQCPFLFSSRESLLDHMYVHRNSAVFCDICKEESGTFGRHHELLKHYYENHQIGKQISCGECENKYYSLLTRENHVNRFHNKARKTYACAQCKLSFNKNQSLTDHEIKAHGAQLLPCSFCEKKFRTSLSRWRHESKHRGQVKEHLCSEPGCGKSFKESRNLKSHMSTVHRGEKLHVCELCGKSYAHKNALVKHRKIVHLNVKPNHMCDVCQKTLSSPESLKRHKLIHNGVKEFACGVCGEQFRHATGLKHHLKDH